VLDQFQGKAGRPPYKRLIGELEGNLDEARQSLRRLKREMLQNEAEVIVGPERALSLPDDIGTAGERAVERALNEWILDITEPGEGGNPERIDHYIRSEEGLHWGSAVVGAPRGTTYQRDKFSWCGAFAAYCWKDVEQLYRHKIFASTYRLWAHWGDRKIPPHEIRGGDIVIVWTRDDRAKRYGHHITLSEGFPDENDRVQTIEGNARGRGPISDRWREGVSRRERALSDVAAVYRPRIADLTTPLD